MKERNRFRLTGYVSGICVAVALSAAGSSAQALSLDEPEGQPGRHRIFYVRQTVGDDANDGLSPDKAWRSVSKLEQAMQAGDTAYVGPGLYREMVAVANSGTAEAPITFIADTRGEYTTDPPGVVMITGADIVDETTFEPHTGPGLYKIPDSEGRVAGVVEMDGPQYRYTNAWDTWESLRGNVPELEVVALKPSTFFYDNDAEELYIHTSDDRPPSTHEIELIRRGYGIVTYDKHYITVIGFTFRHMAVAGINFDKGSSHCIAMNNTSYGAWQGIRVSNSTDVVVAGNTSFRNGNSGIYFLSASTHGYAIGNVLYENAKGVRWSSESANGLALDNVAFDNRENGIAIERADDVRISRNTLVANAEAQLLVRSARYQSQGNCFEIDGEEQLIAELFYEKRYKTLAAYQQAVNQDFGSRVECGRLPERIDVHDLHAEAMAYADRARERLARRVIQPAEIP